MNVIAVECSTNICSVASFKDGSLVNVIDSNEAFSHSKNLPLMFKRISQDFNDYRQDLDCFAISIGPGSFTSLRISLSFIKGLAFGLDASIIPVPTLESLNFSTNIEDMHYIAIDSYRDKCFIQKFKGLEPLEEPYIESLSNLSNLKYEVYGYSSFIKDEKIISPSSVLVGRYVIENKTKLINGPERSINPIYLSENRYIKINDNKGK